MARAPEPIGYPDKPLKLWQKALISGCFIMVALFLFLLIATDRGHERTPDWRSKPNVETANSYDYYWAKEGLVDYRYGILDPEDAKSGEHIIGYCAALIPDIKAAMADGKLTYLEVHNLRTKAVQLDKLHDFQSAKNEALAKLGKPTGPVVECPNGQGLWPNED